MSVRGLVDFQDVGFGEIDRVPVEQAADGVGLLRRGGRSSRGTPWAPSAMSRPRRLAEVAGAAEHLLAGVGVEAEGAADEGGLFRDRRGVGGEDVREDQRVGDAVGELVAGAERVGDGVAGGGVDRAEADAAVEGGEREAGAGLDVGCRPRRRGAR